jgi:hypothetical protein
VPQVGKDGKGVREPGLPERGRSAFCLPVLTVDYGYVMCARDGRTERGVEPPM